MSLFIPSKLSTTFQTSVTKVCPVAGRKYTLTHSDSTGQLFLTVGCEYNYSAINNEIRDEVLAEWVPYIDGFSLNCRVYVSGGEFDENSAKARFMIFQKELHLALNAIVYGDKTFFLNFPQLLDAPIYIHYESIYPQFNQVLYYGTPRQFLI